MNSVVCEGRRPKHSCFPSARVQGHPTKEGSRTKAKASLVTSVPTLKPDTLHLAPNNQVTADLMHAWLCVHRGVGGGNAGDAGAGDAEF